VAWQAWFTLAVVIGLIAVLASERVSAPVAIIGAVAVLVATGVIGTSAALSGFSNEAPLTIAALYVVTGAVEATGALEGFTVRLLHATPPRDARPSRGELTRLLAPIAALSAFIYNTPLTAVSAPATAAWATRTGRRPSWYLLLLNLAILAGGLVTAIGTTTNVVISGLLVASHRHPLALFEPAWVGLPVCLAVVAALVLLGPWLAPDRRPPTEDFADAREFTVEMTVSSGADLAGKTVAEAGLRNLEGVFLVEVSHHGTAVAAVGPDYQLSAGDRLVFSGNVSRVVDLHRISGLVPAAARQFEVGPGGHRQFFEAVISPDSDLAGSTLKAVGFRSRFDAAVVAIHRAGENLQGKLGEQSLRPGDVLLVLADRDFKGRATQSRQFALVAQPDGAPAPPRREKAAIVILIIAGFLIAVVSGLLSVLVAAFFAAILCVLTGAIRTWEARDSINLNVLVFVCGSFGIGTAIAQSGLAGHLASLLIARLHEFGPVGILAGVLLATIVITQLVTNNAAAVLMFPIALATAGQGHLAELPLVMAVLVGASASYLTPIGYQTNMIVYGLGGYRWSDFLRTGLVPLLLLVVVALVVIPLAYPLPAP